MNPLSKIKAAAIALLMVFSAGLVSAATPIQRQDIRCVIDEYGDARFTLTIEFEAQGFTVWKQTVGADPALLKRELKRLFSAAELEDFGMERFDMDRKVIFTFTGRGVARYLGDGQWETFLEERPEGGSMTRRKIDERNFLVTSTQGAEGIGIMQQDTTITLPENTMELKETVSERGEPMLTYRMDVDQADRGSGIPWRTAGISGLVLGGGLFVLGFLVPGKRQD